MNLSAWLFSIPRLVAAVAIALCLWPNGAGSWTITVERDGSGDYSTIQPAVDAAAPGDTILIGPGQYTELNTYYLPGNGEWVEVGAYVQVDNLTFIGAGPEFTTIGASSHIHDGQSPKALVYLDPGTIRIEGIRFANYFMGIHADETQLYIDNSSFDNNVSGVAWHPQNTGGRISNSHFQDDLALFGLMIVGNGQGIVVDECTFDNSMLEIQYVQNFVLRDSEVFNGIGGMQLEAGATGRVENCHFHDITGDAISISPVGASCVVVDSEISGGVDAVWVSAECYFEAWNSIFHGGNNSVIDLDGTQAAYVRNCDLYKGTSTYSVSCTQFQSQGAIRHDFRRLSTELCKRLLMI